MLSFQARLLKKRLHTYVLTTCQCIHKTLVNMVLQKFLKLYKEATKMHRYLKKSRLFRFCYVLTTCAASSPGIFVAATNSTNQTNKAGGTCH